MPQTQSRGRRRNNASRSNRGPRAGRSGSRPNAPRRASSTRTRNRRTRAGNAAVRRTAPTRRGKVAARRTMAVGGASRGRGRGDGSRRSLPKPGGPGTRNPAPFEEMTASAGEDRETDLQRRTRLDVDLGVDKADTDERRHRLIGKQSRRTRQGDPLLVGRSGKPQAGEEE